MLDILHGVSCHWTVVMGVTNLFTDNGGGLLNVCTSRRFWILKLQSYLPVHYVIILLGVSLHNCVKVEWESINSCFHPLRYCSILKTWRFRPDFTWPFSDSGQQQLQGRVQEHVVFSPHHFIKTLGRHPETASKYWLQCTSIAMRWVLPDWVL